MKSLLPISKNERIQSIDVIRGFAIFGIFLVNMLDFSSPWQYLEPGILWPNKVDVTTEHFIDIFAQASFYTLFSFLFGFGMVIFKERAVAKGYDFVPLFSRRLTILLLIGIFHAFLIWHGDILISYALIGFILMLFHNAKPKTLLIWVLAIILIPTLLLGGMYLITDIYRDSTSSGNNIDIVRVNQIIEIYGSGNFSEITLQRFNDWKRTNLGFGTIYTIFILLPMFLLGAYFAKKRLLQDVEDNLPKIKRIWLSMLIIGFTFKLLPYIFNESYTVGFLQDQIGGPATALFYATSITLLMRYNIWKRLLAPFSYVGRVSLSNYLFQSILCTTIFYGYGFGLYGKVNPFTGLILTIVIYLIQILLSQYWLSKYNNGPLEWVWRSLTYKKILPLKKSI
ncbi:MAG: DUF418 domain-containing protein [Vulcanibacillus sp.]